MAKHGLFRRILYFLRSMLRLYVILETVTLSRSSTLRRGDICVIITYTTRMSGPWYCYSFQNNIETQHRSQKNIKCAEKTHAYIWRIIPYAWPVLSQYEYWDYSCCITWSSRAYSQSHTSRVAQSQFAYWTRVCDWELCETGLNQVDMLNKTKTVLLISRGLTGRCPG
jgi:hypothetical protein